MKVSNICYLPLMHISMALSDVINLKSALGFRSPAHTIASILNPLKAPHVLQGVFHPGFN
jgi:anthranilate phosphoribosyltransferase